MKRVKFLKLDFQRHCCCWNRMANLIFCESVHKIGFDSSFKNDSRPLPDFGEETLVMEDISAFCHNPGVTELWVIRDSSGCSSSIILSKNWFQGEKFPLLKISLHMKPRAFLWKQWFVFTLKHSWHRPWKENSKTLFSLCSSETVKSQYLYLPFSNIASFTITRKINLATI